MRFLAWIFVVVLLPGFAYSATLVARSGEHDGFTRVVLRIPAGTAWSLDNVGRSASLTVSLPDMVVDTSQVFSRLNRTRLTGLAQSGPGQALEFELGCACGVKAFLESGSLLVIDITDPIAGPPARSPVRPAFATSPYRFQPQGEMAIELPLVIPSGEAPSAITPAPTHQRNQPAADVRVAVANISEQRLLQQINRAAYQGLLLMDAPPEPHLPADPQAEPIELRTPVETRNPVRSNMVATTVIDRDMLAVSDALSPADNGQSCIGSEFFALHEWGDDRPFELQIGLLRAELFGEFDMVNAQAAGALARMYMYFGFGSEAKHVLTLSGLPREEHRILSGVAGLLDGESTGPANAFARQQGCDGDVAMWSLLSEQIVDSTADFAAVQRAFARLPSHLRLHLGPRISRILTDEGHLEAADVVLRTVNRAANETDSAYDLAEAATTMLRGDAEAASEQFSAVIGHGSEQSPQAVIDLVDAQWQQRAGISPELPELTAAYASEYRRTKLGDELRRAHAVALALSGRFSESFGVLEDIDGADDAGGQRSARIPALTLLTENADDVTFLNFGLQHIESEQSRLPVSVADAMARRMLDLGFAEPALRLLRGPGAAGASESRQLMRAQGALAQNLPQKAMIELLSLTGNDAARLRAQAMWQVGDYRRAADYLIAAGETNDATRGLWHSDQWDTLPTGSDTRYGQIAAVSLELAQGRVPPGPLTPLAEAEALIAASEGARNNISGLRTFVGAPAGHE